MKKLVSLLPVLFLCGHAAAEPGQQNLIDLYRKAQTSDPAWAAAQNTHLAAQEKLVQGRALNLPSVSLSARANHTNSDLKYRGGGGAFSAFRAGGGSESFENWGYGVNVNQPLYRRQNRIQYEEAQTQVAQADEELGVARLDLMTRISQAYFDVLLAQDRLDLIAAQKTAITRQLEQAQANFEVGTATITDVHEAQARFDLLLAQEIAARNDFEARQRAIQALTGEMPQRLSPAREQLAVGVPAPQDMEQWVELAEQQSYQLKVQQRQLEFAGQEVARAHAGHLPTLDAVGGYNDNRSNGSPNGIGSSQQDFTIGLQLQVPLYQGGAITSREREAVANRQRAADELERARRSVGLQTRQAYLAVTSAVAQVKAYEQALASSQSSLDSTTLGYEVGVRTSVDVLNAQQQFYSAKRDLLQARYTWLLSVIKLKAAAGVLTEHDLASTSLQLAGT